MPEQAITTVQVVTWLMAGTSLAVTVTWNLLNRAHTNKLAARIRGETFKFSVWKDARDAVLSRLRDFENKGHELKVLASRESDLTKLSERIHEVGYAMTLAQLALAKDLGRLRSERLASEEWIKLAEGPRLGTESAWDRIMAIIGEAAASGEIDDARAKLRTVPPLIAELERALNAEIAVENALHDPVKI